MNNPPAKIACGPLRGRLEVLCEHLEYLRSQAVALERATRHEPLAEQATRRASRLVILAEDCWRLANLPARFDDYRGDLD